VTSYSLKEAAALAGVSELSVRKAVAAKVICPVSDRAGQAPRYRFRTRDIFYLHVIATFPFDLSREDKQALREIIVAKRHISGRWHLQADQLVIQNADCLLSLDLKPARCLVAQRLLVFHRGQHRIVSQPEILGGEPVFAGTRIPLSHIAGLLRKKTSVADLHEDYPTLSPLDFEFAAMVARMKPNPGRRRKPIGLLRSGQPVITKDRYVVMHEAPAG
jgi:uncharacterized protein (DUF433 family)